MGINGTGCYNRLGRCRRAGTRHGAVTTASRDAGAQVRIIYVDASLMTLGAARDVRLHGLGLAWEPRVAGAACCNIVNCALALSYYSVA